MNTEQNQVPQDTEKLKEIPKWTRRYAQNRTLTLLVLSVMIMLFSMAAFPLALGIVAIQKGKVILALICIFLLVPVIIFYVIFLLKFGGKNRGRIDHLIDQWIYGNEATASIPKPELTKKKKWVEIAFGIVFGICFIGTNYLGMENFIQAKYVQPVSALFCVPYMVFGWYFYQSPKMGPIYLLHPILYAIHAILIVAGVPLFFTGQLGPALNMCLPYVGYGLLTYVIGHFYSRYALKKLKGIAHLGGDAANGV